MLTKRTLWVSLKWVVLLGLGLVLLSLQTAPGLFEIFGVRPLLLFPFCICVAVFFDHKDAALLALFCGGIWDSAAAKLFGFSSLMLVICCLAASLLIMYLIKANLINALFLTAGALFVYYLVYFVFSRLVWGYESVWVFVVFDILPMMGYTLAITPLFYYLCRWLFQKLRMRE